MTSQEFNTIYSYHRPMLQFDGARQRPVLVAFSAVPGSGKSTLTSHLVNDFGFILVANKHVREAIDQAGFDPSVGSDYTLTLLNILTDDTQPSIVLDRNIDQWYEQIVLWCRQRKYELVVVRINVTYEILKRRIQARRPDDRDHTFEVLDFYLEQHALLGNSVAVSLELVDDFDLNESAQHIADF
ncbi:hypothetical protein HJC99_02375 [Candidatus Saccharibacteria bacterium]|nr:hypothetical protein [Candidatus Saccharibacteria bacterium]